MVSFPKTGSNVVRNQYLGYKDLEADDIGGGGVGVLGVGGLGVGRRRLDGEDEQKSSRHGNGN